MPGLALTILYVDSPRASAAFYQQVLGAPPIEESDTFVMFKPQEGAGLGLWSRHTVEPAATAPGGCEVALIAADVDAVHTAWVALGWPIEQAPADMDFGRTFVARDPDGHRIRVFKPTPG